MKFKIKFMKSKYITLQIRMACLSKPVSTKKDIHAQLEETIAEREKIMRKLKNISRAAKVIDMYITSTQAA
jgi:hypothetical protein